jgi:hypothetical protein
MEPNERGQIMLFDQLYFNLTKSKIFEKGEDDGCAMLKVMVTIRDVTHPSRVR